jgi:hypothetical protein
MEYHALADEFLGHHDMILETPNCTLRKKGKVPYHNATITHLCFPDLVQPFLFDTNPTHLVQTAHV